MSTAYTSPSEIKALVESLNKAAASFETAAASQGDVHLARWQLQHEAQKLLSSLEEPNGAVWTRTFQVSLQLALLQARVKVMCHVDFASQLFCHRSTLVPRLKLYRSLSYGTRSKEAKKSPSRKS